mgnify:FL=1
MDNTERRRIVNLPQATEVGDDMNFVTDSTNGSGTRKLPYEMLRSAISQASALNLAPAYSNAATYSVGDLVAYGGQLYMCSTAITNAENWTPAHWTAVDMSRVIDSVEQRVAEIENAEGLHRYGVSGIGQAASQLTRIWDSVGMTAQVGTDGNNANVVNNFDDVAPFNRRKSPAIQQGKNFRPDHL